MTIDMNKKHEAITIATLAWQLIEEVKIEDERSKVAIISPESGEKAYVNSLKFFIDNNIIEPTDVDQRYILTEWFFDAMKLYLERHVH